MRKFLVSTAAGLAIATGTIALGAFGPVSAFAKDTTPATQPADGGQADANGRHHARHHVAKEIVKDAAGVIGIPAKDLATALKAGQSIAEVATAHGVDSQTVIDKLSADATARIDKAIADGKITAERGATMKSKVGERVTKVVNRHFDGTKRPNAG